MIESTELTERLAVLRDCLPGTTADIAAALEIAPSRVPGLMRQLRKSGYVVIKERGVYRGAATLDAHEVALAEHRDVAYLASRAATLAAQFPTSERDQAAAFWAAELAHLDASIRDHRKVARWRRRAERYASMADELEAALA